MKTLHRVCDGLQAMAIVDQEGRVQDVMDLSTSMATDAVPYPIASLYTTHAAATLNGDTICLAYESAASGCVCAKDVLHYLMRNRNALDMPVGMLESVPAIDRAVVLNATGEPMAVGPCSALPAASGGWRALERRRRLPRRSARPLSRSAKTVASRCSREVESCGICKAGASDGAANGR